jgi:thiol-disulfide isomerase/thioredoxin
MSKVTEITSLQQLELLKTGEFSCLLVKSKGCSHCEAVTPILTQLSEATPFVKFYSLELDAFPEVTTLYDLYSGQEQQWQVVEHEGKQQVAFMFNEDGTPKMSTKVSVPQFFIFHKDERDEDDEYGLVGTINGNVPEKIQGVFEALTKRYKPQQYPALTKGIASLGKILIDKVKGVDNKVEESIRLERLAKCQACPNLNKTLNTCKICFCIIKEKTKYKHESCPDGRWGSVTP